VIETNQEEQTSTEAEVNICVYETEMVEHRPDICAGRYYLADKTTCVDSIVRYGLSPTQIVEMHKTARNRIDMDETRGVVGTVVVDFEANTWTLNLQGDDL
jgi:hypothetical protein